MKKIFLCIMVFAISLAVAAQDTPTTTVDTANATANNTETKAKKEKKEKTIAGEMVEKVTSKPVLFKDRIVLDFMTSYWFGMKGYEDISANNFNFSFNGAIIFDIPVKHNSPFSFGIGLGVSNYNMYSNAIFGIGKGYTTSMTPIPEFIADSNIRVNKLSYTNMHIPIEFRYRHKCGFKIAVGVRVGLTVDLHSKYFGPALNGSEDKDLIKDYKIVNRTKVPVEVTFRTGWKFVGVSVSYMVTKLFEAEKGPQICPLSVGISLSPY